MEVLSNKRCVIGEGPIWNATEGKLYYVNAFADEVCTWEPGGRETVRKYDFSVGAMGFCKDGRMLASCTDGVFYLNEDGSRTLLAEAPVYCNDAKVGPDGRFYVGTQSRKRLGISEAVDGCFYSIDRDGCVKMLLTGLLLSNGFDWSVDERFLYHTDSDTHTIREYAFDKVTGNIAYTGREVSVPGVDGLTVGQDGSIYAACWGRAHVAVVDCRTMTVTRHMDTPVNIPVSCCFMGKDMGRLVITSAAYGKEADAPLAGCTFIADVGTTGRKPYLFG